MDMNKTRTLIREQRLEKFARILSNRYNIELKLSAAKHKVGCCDTTSKIWISSTIDENPIHNLLLQKATALHEIGHILFTDSRAWSNMHVSQRFANVLDDGRVEEAISRVFPKARLYFIYLNRRLNPVVIQKRQDNSININDMIYQLVFREAKRTVGIPQLPIEIKRLIKKKIGKDKYDWIIAKTREVVDAKTDKEAAKIAYDLQMKLEEITQEQCNIGVFDKSMSSCGSNSRQMPQQKEDEILDRLNKLHEMEEKQIDNQITLEQEQEVFEETLNEDTEITENIKKDSYKPNEIEDVSLEEQQIDNFFDDIRKTSVEPEQDEEATNDNKESDINIDDSLDSSTNNNQSIDESGQIPESIEDIQKQIEDSIIKIANQVEDKISKDAEDELRNENDTMQSGEADPDFGSYDTVDKDDMNPKGAYGVSLRPVDITKLDPVARKISRQFKIIAQYGDGWLHNQTRGRLEMHKIHTVIDKNKRARIFRKKDEIESVDLGVVILLDASNSMVDRRFVATDTAYTIARALELGNYKSEVVQFGVERSSNKVFGIKSFNQKTQYARKRFKPVAEGLTPMYEALEGADKSLSNQDAKRKVCFVITDGYPFVMGESQEEYREKCRKKILSMEKKGVRVIGVLVQTSDVRHIFHEDRKIICKELPDIEKKMLEVLKKVLIKLKET